MSFKMVKEAERYYKMVDERRDGGAKYKFKFDFYYLCLMAGLNFRTRGDSQQKEELQKAEPFVNYYIELYRDKADLIAGLLIDAEMDRKGIEPEDKNGIQKLMLTLIDHMSNTKLSTAGIELLNLYSVGGFNLLKDAIPATSELEVFLVRYHQFMNSQTE